MEKYEFIRLDRAERWIVVMHPGSPLAQKDYITAEDLKEVPLILPRRLNVRSELAHWFGEYYDELNVLFTSNLPSNSAVMAHNRLACAIAIQGSISFWDREKIVCCPLSPELSANSVLAWKTSTALRSGCRQVHRIPEGNAGKVFQYVVMISMLQSGFQLTCGRTGCRSMLLKHETS